MSMNKLMIPNKIHVGFNKRNDTYTGMLGYVIYTDAKGVRRKETSWNSWKDDKIETQDFDNVPTSGFVLNKKVGGGRGWDGRATYTRIYDPRNFEFEITIPNLLFILEECSSIKGKGLEGEFVYAWDKADLVLLPVTSQEYKLSSGHTALQTQIVTKDKMKEGYTYLNKDGHKVLYLGRHIYNERCADHLNDSVDYTYYVKSKKKHIFVDLDDNRLWVQDGFTKLASVVSSDVSPLYADEFTKFKKSFEGSLTLNLKEVPVSLDEINGDGSYYYYKSDAGIHGFYFYDRRSEEKLESSINANKYLINFEEVKVTHLSDRIRNSSYYGWNYNNNRVSTKIKDVIGYGIFKLVYVNEYNEEFKTR